MSRDNDTRRLLKAMTEVDDPYIQEAAGYYERRKKPSARRMVLVRRTAGIAAALAACCILAVIVGQNSGSSGASSSSPDYAVMTSEASDEYEDAASTDTAAFNGIATETPESAYRSEAAAESAESASASAADDTAEEIQKKIIYSADVSAETNDYETAKDQLNELLSRYDGFIASSSEYDNGSGTVRQRSYYVTVRIPAEHFNAFLNGMNSLSGKITSQNVTSDDMTKTYSDNADRIEALETEQEALLDLLAKADSVESMIAIQNELTDIRAELAQLHHQNSGIDYDVQYSTVNISLNEVVTYAPERVRFGERISNAVTQSGSSFLNFLQNLLIGIILLLPYLILLLIIVLIVRYIIRRRRRKK